MSSGIARFAHAAGRVIPDAMSASILLLLLLAAAALAIGNSAVATAEAWYRGLWMLLPFSMQMVLILVLSAVISATPMFRSSAVTLARLPRSATQAIALSVLITAAVSYLYWGLGYALGPLIAIHFCRVAEDRGIHIDFPFLLAVLQAAASVWQFGLSSSAALLVATPGHFLEEQVGVMPLRTTIWSPAAIAIELMFLAALIVIARLIMPRTVEPISRFPASAALAKSELEEEGPAAAPAEGFSGWAERSPIFPALLIAALFAWLWQHFVVHGSGLDLNSMNSMLLVLALAFHRNIACFSAALRRAIVSCWSIVILYQLYAGIAGVLQYTTAGAWFAEQIAASATRFTFPALTALASTAVAMFVPSSGGQWVIQGFVTSETAAALGVSAQRGLLALGVGDQMGNLISPFWVVIAAGIARIDFRKVFGYCLIFSLLWFAIGVTVLTVTPDLTSPGGVQ